MFSKLFSKTLSLNWLYNISKSFAYISSCWFGFRFDINLFCEMNWRGYIRIGKVLSKTNGCQPLCFIGLSTSVFYRSARQVAQPTHFVQNYTHFYLLSAIIPRWLCDTTFPCHGLWVLGIWTSSRFKTYLCSTKYFWWIAGKKFYVIAKKTK